MRPSGGLDRDRGDQARPEPLSQGPRRLSRTPLPPGRGRVNLSLNLEPVYTIILAILIYHENKELRWSFYLGLGLIILSVVLQMLQVMRAHRNAGPVVAESH